MRTSSQKCAGSFSKAGYGYRSNSTRASLEMRVGTSNGCNFFIARSFMLDRRRGQSSGRNSFDRQAMNPERRFSGTRSPDAYDVSQELISFRIDVWFASKSMKAIQGYHLIKLEDLFWRPSNLMK